MGLFSDFIVNLIRDKASQNEVLEEALSEAMDAMWSMCGSAGQETIIEQGAAGFENWASACVRNPDGGCSYEDFLGKVVVDIGDEKYQATNEIWDEGMDIVVSYAEEAADAESEEGLG